MAVTISAKDDTAGALIDLDLRPHVFVIELAAHVDEEDGRPRLSPADPSRWLSALGRLVGKDYEGRCAYCERLTWSHRDHVQALSRGGEHVIANLVPACAGCNMDKGSSRDWQPKRRHPFMVPA